jgi:1-acyl-sn-glycerol-3-phosphate acyltransferase
MYKKIVHIIKMIVVLMSILLLGFIPFTLRVLSFGMLTSFNRKYLAPVICKFTLFLIGMRIEIHLPEKLPHPAFITFNHNSILDAFGLMAMGLSETRFLMTELILYQMPFGNFMAWGVGCLFIPPKSSRERRIAFLKNCVVRMKKESCSIAGSSEGVHRHEHGICRFNRGVYHMALAAEVPVVALYIHLPEINNPFNDYRAFESGTMHITHLETFQTVNWKLNSLDEHIEVVRNAYIEEFKKRNQS